MAVVASTTVVERVPPVGKAHSEEWKAPELYLEHIDRFYKEALVDVIKITCRTAKLKNVPIPSLSNATWQARDELQKDPYDLKQMHNLGMLYAKEGQHEQCLNVMMRGWKRVGEIPDKNIQFRVLMRLAELSMGFWKYKQALAVFRDIEEPSEARELKSYLILGTQIWSNNGDIQQSLKLFQRCIEGEPFNVAVRIFAVLVLDLKKVGAYEAAKSTMENMGQQDHTDLMLLDTFVQKQQERKPVVTEAQLKRRFIYATGGIIFVFFLCLLYYLEQQSFAAIKDSTS